MEIEDKTPKEGKSAEGFSSILNVVPVIYYDLIARVCPGLVFILALYLKENDKVNITKLASQSLDNIFIFFVISYVVGIVLTGSSFIWDYLTYKFFLIFKSKLGHLGLDASENFEQNWELVGQKMESIAKENEAAGRVVAKVLAEVALCQNLLTGLIILILLGWFSCGEIFFNPRVHMTYFIIILILLILSTTFRQGMFLGRVNLLYKTFVESKTSSET